MWSCLQSSIRRSLLVGLVTRSRCCSTVDSALHSFRLVSTTSVSSHRQLRSDTTSTGMQYQLPRLDQVEDVEKYKIGGFHPIHLGDTFEDGRYRILHKLGFGGFSTAWLARDNHLRRLVSLKVVTADASCQQKELQISQYLDENAKGNPYRDNILTILNTFTIQGPNGRHVCYVSQLAGPSIARLYDCPGRTIGSRRLHGPLARKLAGQLASTISLLHSIGIVHGGNVDP